MTKVEHTLIFFNKDFTRFWYITLIFPKLLDYPDKPNRSGHSPYSSSSIMFREMKHTDSVEYNSL